MEVQQVLHMAGGDGEYSYALNSTFQKLVMAQAKPFIRRAATELFSQTLPQCLTIADLGCSSGPNAFLLIADIIDTVLELRSKNGYSSHEFQMYLNDLPGNDFNTLFKFLPHFREHIERNNENELGPCFVTAVPGTFYGRLFPANSLFFVHSSFSLHWLSQFGFGSSQIYDYVYVPRGIESDEKNIHLAQTSPPSVLNAYLKQFESDFSLFLKSRSEEMISGGRMVLTMNGRRSPDPRSKDSCKIWELLGKSLFDLVEQGMVEEEKLHSFNLPLYTPNTTELSNVIGKEGSFHLESLETFEVKWEANDDPDSKDLLDKEITFAERLANTIRAVAGPMLVNHFGEEIIGELFEKFAQEIRMQFTVEEVYRINVLVHNKERSKPRTLI